LNGKGLLIGCQSQNEWPSEVYNNAKQQQQQKRMEIHK